MQGSQGGAGSSKQGGDGEWMEGQGGDGEEGAGKRRSVSVGAEAQGSMRVMVGDKVRGFTWET